MAKRKAHVKRIFSGDPSVGAFTDVMRLDKLPVTFNTLPDGRLGMTVVYKFVWNDDANNPVPGVDASNADDQHENAVASRKTKLIGAYNLWIVERCKIAWNGKETGTQGQIINYSFKNDLPSKDPTDVPSENSTDQRKVTAIKITSNDLNHNEMTNADGTSKIIDWDEYKQWLRDGSKSTEVRLIATVEVVDSFKISFAADEKTGMQGQIIKYVLSGNKELYTDTEEGSALFDKDDPNSVSFRIDPLQIIVNVGEKPKHPPVALWKYVPTSGGASIVDGNVQNGWILVMKSDEGAQAHGYKEALIELHKEGYGDLNYIRESKASGLVSPPYYGVPESSTMFDTFHDAAAAAADTAAEGPTSDPLTFLGRWIYVAEFYSIYKDKAFVQTWYKLHP